MASTDRLRLAGGTFVTFKATAIDANGDTIGTHSVVIDLKGAKDDEITRAMFGLVIGLTAQAERRE